MLRTETKNVERLVEHPHVRPPRRLLWALNCSRAGASIFGYGPHSAAMWKCPRRWTRAEAWRGAAGRRINARGVRLFLRAGAGAGAGTLYRYRLDGEAALYPDPASRFQPWGRMALHRSSIQTSLTGMTVNGRRTPCRAGHL